MSRTAAKLDGASRKIDKELEARGVIGDGREPKRARGGATEGAYKNVDDVVDVVHQADLSRKVARK